MAWNKTRKVDFINRVNSRNLKRGDHQPSRREQVPQTTSTGITKYANVSQATPQVAPAPSYKNISLSQILQAEGFQTFESATNEMLKNRSQAEPTITTSQLTDTYTESHSTENSSNSFLPYQLHTSLRTPVAASSEAMQPPGNTRPESPEIEDEELASGCGYYYINFSLFKTTPACYKEKQRDMNTNLKNNKPMCFGEAEAENEIQYNYQNTDKYHQQLQEDIPSFRLGLSSTSKRRISHYQGEAKKQNKKNNSAAEVESDCKNTGKHHQPLQGEEIHGACYHAGLPSILKPCLSYQVEAKKQRKVENAVQSGIKNRDESYPPSQKEQVPVTFFNTGIRPKESNLKVDKRRLSAQATKQDEFESMNQSQGPSESEHVFQISPHTRIVSALNGKKRHLSNEGQTNGQDARAKVMEKWGECVALGTKKHEVRNLTFYDRQMKAISEATKPK